MFNTNLKLSIAQTQAEIEIAEKIGRNQILIPLFGALFTPSHDNGNIELYQDQMKEAEKIAKMLISCLLPYEEQKEDKIEEEELIRKYMKAFNLSD